MKTAIEIPVPGNPQHTHNLASLALLAAQGFRGPDCSLEISLSEYGMAWRELEDEILFIFCFYRDTVKSDRFERTTFKKDLDVLKEFNWVSWTDFTNAHGIVLAEWLKLPLEIKIYDLFNYYGFENIFGGVYWDGFEILDNENKPIC